MKIAISLGTRPEIIKMSPIIRLLDKNGYNFILIHSGQHYSKDMDSVFFEELNLPKPDYNLNVGSSTHALQTSKILKGIEPILVSEKPDIILVQGDTNTVLASALAASKLGIKVGHIEAGLRSFDNSMPEEVNRILTDHISSLLFCPTEISVSNVIKEGIDSSKVFLTGNTIVDSLYYYDSLITKHSILKRYKVLSKDYFLATIHRQENVDVFSRLEAIINSLKDLSMKYNKEILFPVHPRTMKMINKFKLCTEPVNLINPVGYLDFLSLQKNAKLILTDSGGVQEESCILGVPCITLRNNTERPETVNVGSNILTDVESDSVLSAASILIDKSFSWQNPFGDGNSAQTIIDIIKDQMAVK